MLSKEQNHQFKKLLRLYLKYSLDDSSTCNISGSLVIFECRKTRKIKKNCVSIDADILKLFREREEILFTSLLM